MLGVENVNDRRCLIEANAAVEAKPYKPRWNGILGRACTPPVRDKDHGSSDDGKDDDHERDPEAVRAGSS